MLLKPVLQVPDVAFAPKWKKYRWKFMSQSVKYLSWVIALWNVQMLIVTVRKSFRCQDACTPKDLEYKLVEEYVVDFNPSIQEGLDCELNLLRQRARMRKWTTQRCEDRRGRIKVRTSTSRVSKQNQERNWRYTGLSGLMAMFLSCWPWALSHYRWLLMGE